MAKSAIPLKWEIAQQLMDNLRRDKMYRELLLVAVGTHTAFRVSDYANIKWSDLIDAEQITRTEMKTRYAKKKPRTAYVGPSFKAIIDECQAVMNPYRRDDFVFKPKRGGQIRKHISRGGVNKILKAVVQKYGIKEAEDISSHSLRKCFAMRAYEVLGKNESALLEVSSLLSHSNTRITVVYLGIDERSRKEVYKSFF